MNKSQALKALRKQRQTSALHNQDMIWISETLSYYEDIFGKSSNEYLLMGKFVESAGAGRRGETSYSKHALDNINKLLDSHIGILRVKGVNPYRNGQLIVKTNILSRISDEWIKWIIGGIVSAIVGVFWIGYYIGGNYGTPEKIRELEFQNEWLKRDTASLHKELFDRAAVQNTTHEAPDKAANQQPHHPSK